MSEASRRRKRERDATPRTDWPVIPNDQLHRVLADAYRGEPRYLAAMQRVMPDPHDDRSDVRLHGDDHPTLFRTLRNAIQTAMDGPVWLRSLGVRADRYERGAVLRLDLASLPVVNLTDPSDQGHAGFPGDTPRAFAERQMLWWTAEVERLDRLERGLPIPPLASGKTV